MKFVNIFLLVLIVAGVGLLVTQKKWVPKVVDFILAKEAAIKDDKRVPPIQSGTEKLDYKNIEYVVDGGEMKFTNGVNEFQAPNSSAKVETRFFGNELRKDVDGDGREDVVFLLSQTGGGTGIFYFAVAALNKSTGYVGTEAIYIGDRIAPQTTESGGGRSVIINYIDRKPGEPMTAKPSVGKSLRILLNPTTLQFGEVAENFEGEANPSVMTLPMKTWKWVETMYNDGTIVTPNKDKFTLTFKTNGTFSATTDCNGVGGEYSTKQGSIAFEKMMSTLMYCEGSQEADFRKNLSNSTSYHFTSKGELILDLKYDSGSVVFR